MAAEDKSDRKPLRYVPYLSELHKFAHSKNVQHRFVREEEQ